jgi:hypothetical protein
MQIEQMPTKTPTFSALIGPISQSLLKRTRWRNQNKLILRKRNKETIETPGNKKKILRSIEIFSFMCRGGWHQIEGRYLDGGREISMVEKAGERDDDEDEQV